MIRPSGAVQIVRFFVLASIAIALPSCMGSWAQDTHVALASVPPSTVHGDAEVAQATLREIKCKSVGGSDILLTLSHARPKKDYEIVLAEGSCSTPVHKSSVVGSGNGDALTGTSLRIHVNTPIHALTKTDYILVIRESGSRTAAACGPISADAPY